MTDHHRYMQAALSLARRNLGQTWPNPSVGALVVHGARIVGSGYTARGGRPHAETQALAEAGEQARGATLYVTLEPCAHQGKTPPCTQAIIEAGIQKAVIACRDPDPRVNGEGIARLRAAGIDVIEGVGEAEAREVNRGFLSVIEKNRPYIALKIASSLDGKIAFPPGGGGRWITGEPARRYGHGLRSRYDAVATGIGTALADDPLLTCRLPGLTDRSPVRIVFDRRGRLPAASKLAQTAKDVPLWIMAGSTVTEAVKTITEKGITRLLVEAGRDVTTAFLRSGMVDRVYWFRAPFVIGEGGMSAIGDRAFPAWRLIERISLAPDALEVYECSPA